MQKYFKRIGTKAHKFRVEILFKKVEIKVNFQCKMKVIWKKGKKAFSNNLIVSKGKKTFTTGYYTAYKG